MTHYPEPQNTISKKRGRPQSDWRKILQRLQLGFAWGYPLSFACESTGVNKKTVYNLIKRVPEFAKEIEASRHLDFDKLEKHYNRINELTPEELSPKIYQMVRKKYRYSSI